MQAASYRSHQRTDRFDFRLKQIGDRELRVEPANGLARSFSVPPPDALIDDASAGFAREPFQGIGIAGQTVGPYGTLLRLDIGKSIGRNAQDGFVANVVFLKLF